MATTAVEGFVRALQQAEEKHDPQPLVDVFSDDGETWSVARPVSRTGKEAIRRFWSDYLSAFAQVRSEFTRVIEHDGSAALEWRSDATLSSGQRLQYQGVSLIEVDGGKVTRFRTYFDPRRFTTHS